LSPRRLYASGAAAALVAAALLIALSQVSAHRGSTPASSQPSSSGMIGSPATNALFAGIPQDGNVLGSPSAPVRLLEYADPQCPYCAVYARDVLPTVLREYVRTGKVQLVYRGLWFLGPDSGVALATAVAAGRQNRFWNVIDLLYRNQGPENAWVNDPLLRKIVVAAGADPQKVFGARKSSAVLSAIDTWSAQAKADGVTGVPAFLFGRRGGRLNRLALTAITVPQFRAALDGALQG
jgi:protein-disulfide isomerase